jgi:hypothetical protein
VFQGNAVSNWPLLYVGGQDVTVRGITFVYDQPGMVFLCNPPLQNSGLVVADCTFRRCNLGFYLGGCLIRDCVFDRGGAVIAPGGLYLRCQFNGPSMQHAWSHWGQLGPTALIDPFFRDTDRGPVFSAANAPIEDFLCVGLTCRGIDRTPNGNEIVLVEGANPFRRSQFFHTRISCCQSSLFQFDQVAADLYARDLFMDGGMGVLLWGKDVSNVTVQDFELRNGAGIYVGPKARNCSFIDGSVIAWAPGRGNQHWQNPGPFGHLRTVACWSDGPNAATNKLTRVPVLALPAGLTAVRGFTETKAPAP